MTMPMTASDFLEDKGGRLFAKVAADPDLDFTGLLGFLQDPARVQRMKDAELHHDRPALAGVVRELESPANFGGYVASLSPSARQRFNQCVGYIIKLIMLSQGWIPAGRKGALGRRDTERPGAYVNTETSFSRYFIRAERYTPPTDRA
jgi:hypothetical protein